MLISTRGIVLRTVKFSETSIITKIYTEACGLQSYIVNGVRKQGKGNKSPLFQPFNILDLVIYKRENKNLQRLKEFRIGHIFKSLPFDIIKSSISLFLIEILNLAIREEEKNEALFQFIERSIIDLDNSNSGRECNFHVEFLVHFTRYLGFFPSGENLAKKQFFDLKEGEFVSDVPVHPFYLSARESFLLDKIITGNSVTMSQGERNEFLEKMLQYYELHLAGFRKIKSHKILHEVLEAGVAG